MRYKTVVADPPWKPDLGGTWNARADKGRPQRFYATMEYDEIETLRPDLDDQAHVYIWCLAQHADLGFRLARAWGAEPVTMLTWRKPGLGVGRFQCNTEHVVVARKGSRHGNPFGQGGRNAPATGGTCFDWPRGKHSEKPDDFFALVERLSLAPRLEMYARAPRVGWDVFGDQVPASIPLRSA